MAMTRWTTVVTMASVIVLFFVTTATGFSELRPPTLQDEHGNVADENSKITWATQDEPVKYKMEGESFQPGALNEIFKMVNGFIDVVMPKDPPYGM